MEIVYLSKIKPLPKKDFPKMTVKVKKDLPVKEVKEVKGKVRLIRKGKGKTSKVKTSPLPIKEREVKEVKEVKITKEVKARQEVCQEVLGNTVLQILPVPKDKEDLLSIANLRIMERIARGENLDFWEFENVDNMSIYLRGSINRGMISVYQDKQESLDTMDLDTLSERLKETSQDFYQSFLDDINYTPDRDLFQSYYVDRMTLENISVKLGFSIKTVHKRLKRIDKVLKTKSREQSIKLPENLWQAVKENGKHKNFSEVVYLSEVNKKTKTHKKIALTSLSTNLSLLRKHRRSPSQELLEGHRERSNKVRVNQVKVTGEGLSSPLFPSCPLNYDTRNVNQIPLGKTFKSIHPFNRYSRKYGEPLTYKETWKGKGYLRNQRSKFTQEEDRLLNDVWYQY